MTVLTQVYPKTRHLRSSNGAIPPDEAARTCARETYGPNTSIHNLGKILGFQNRYAADVTRQSPVTPSIQIPCGQVIFELLS